MVFAEFLALSTPWNLSVFFLPPLLLGFGGLAEQDVIYLTVQVAMDLLLDLTAVALLLKTTSPVRNSRAVAVAAIVVQAFPLGKAFIGRRSPVNDVPRITFYKIAFSVNACDVLLFVIVVELVFDAFAADRSGHDVFLL